MHEFHVAYPARFTSQGGGILDMLGELKTEAEDSLSTMRKSEMESNHKFEMLKMSLETELKNMKERLSDATNEKSGEEESAAGRMECRRAVSIFGRSRIGLYWAVLF